MFGFWESCENWLRGLVGMQRPMHLRIGKAGEKIAKKYLISKKMKFLYANFKYKKDEIDLIFRDGQYLVFVEVKTRTQNKWNVRPVSAVNTKKREKIYVAIRHYLKMLHRVPPPPWRVDIVEVLLDNSHALSEIHHIPGIRIKGFPPKKR